MTDLMQGYDSITLAKQENQTMQVNLARVSCESRIELYYPLWQQLNVMRAGSDVEKSKMGIFIDACRAWSNGVNPDPAALLNIKP
ncbi:hypothetical protein [Chromobacterium sp. IIBBL 290-4]|uniref:hypothetical protein n=1 Tax=Chromobacterium sp. IIBBL 290-4 TaxID=2953890 RepID=UPI0020B7C592|nr:hypothetical protein [Chromobacterium sp. IIBBL 290-4]UTH76109.1 hypothetical protein NKT35_08405 [Chromobacterium sp. IIBBL 290-4]